MGFDGIAQFLEDQFERALGDLVTYFGPFERRARGQEPVGFTGRYFESMIELSDHNRICASDFVAPALLSAPLRPDAIATLISIEDQLNELIRHKDFPSWGLNLWEVPESAIDDGSPLSELYSTIRTIKHVGPTRASKLLAVKRPHLVPIRDKRVSALLGRPRLWWQPWRNLLLDQQVSATAEHLITAAGPSVPTGLTVLRCLDVVLWREAERRGF